MTALGSTVLHYILEEIYHFVFFSDCDLPMDARETCHRTIYMYQKLTEIYMK